MSEFTSGNLTLTAYKDQLDQSKLNYIKELNEEWVVFFTDDTDISDNVSDTVLHLSEQLPVLYFYNAEDHGWGYRIFFGRKCLASLDINYELEDA
ncbi:hypothetical protein [Paenibacillus sinopodophylli]|uniref:hypothetical protein n=1 Tax=Paenibacillus sinopodophylli TaxID=1837342 RepID=UPI00110CF75E|nr:hypothetical protein [Paenibacillus sinopodophylli]